MKATDPVLGIINDCDSPEAKMIVIVFGAAHSRRYEYIDQRLKPIKGHGPTFKEFTPISAFGVKATFEQDGDVRFTQVRESEAKYSDGMARRWQERGAGIVSIRPSLAGLVFRAVRGQA